MPSLHQCLFLHGCSNSGEKPKSRDKSKVGERVSLEYLLSELSDDDINAQ